MYLIQLIGIIECQRKVFVSQFVYYDIISTLQKERIVSFSRFHRGDALQECFVFDGDIGTLKQAINTVDKSSPVVQNMLTYLTGLLGDQSYDNAYEDAISHVSRSMP